MLEADPNHWIELNKLQVLSSKRHEFPRLVKEAIETKKYPNINREDGFRIPCMCKPVISLCEGGSRCRCSKPNIDSVSVVCRGEQVRPCAETSRPKRRKKRVDRFFLSVVIYKHRTSVSP